MRLLFLAILVFTLSPIFGRDLTLQYNTHFQNKDFNSALKVIKSLVETTPENMEYRREHAKMLAATGKDKEFLDEIVSIRESEHKESVKAILSVIEHELVPHRLKNLAKSYFISQNDRFVLAGWPKEKWEKLRDSGQMIIERPHTKVTNEAEAYPNIFENEPNLNSSQDMPDSSISNLPVKKQQPQPSPMQLARAQDAAKQVINFCEHCLESDFSDTINTITPSARLLKYCKEYPQFSYLVFPEFLRVLKLGRENAIKQKFGLNWIIFSRPAKEILIANKVSNFTRSQKAELVAFFMTLFIFYGYNFENGFFRPTPNQMHLLREFPDAIVWYLDSIKEEEVDGMKLRVEALKKGLKSYGFKF